MASSLGHPARPGQIVSFPHAHPETEAKRLEAAALCALRRALSGRAAHTTGSRSATYRQAQLRGEHVWSGRDDAELALEAPLAWVAKARVLAAAAHHQVVPVDVLPAASDLRSVRVALDAASALVGEVLGALEDGQIQDHEIPGLLDRTSTAMRALCAVDARLRRIA